MSYVVRAAELILLPQNQTCRQLWKVCGVWFPDAVSQVVQTRTRRWIKHTPQILLNEASVVPYPKSLIGQVLVEQYRWAPVRFR